MLYRKFARRLEEFLNNEPRKILLVNGARQIGKSYIIRYVGKQLFKNFVEINLKADKEGMGIFQSVRSVDDFYLQLGAIAGDKLGNKQDTIVFFDEIQSYPHLMTMLKFLNEEGRYRYIASGSELGVALAQTPSVPIGSIAIEQMYPLDFEEFLLAMGCGQNTIDGVRRSFENRQSLNDSMHNYMLQQFKLYLLVGGMPDAINKFLENRNITQVRNIQRDIHTLYRIDASQYDEEKKLVIRNIYDLIPSNMENKKKRIIVKNIEGKSGHKQYSDYAEEFEYLTNSGVVLQVRAISNPKFPLLESESKNLLKLYLSDVGLLTNLLFGTNVNAVLGDVLSINLGSVYESVVAQELHAHGFQLHYYDNKQRGEVNFLIDDYDSLTVLPIEVKSGKDYKVHSALDRFIATPDYHISRAVVLSNEQKVYDDKGITYMPVYYVMFFKNLSVADSDCIIPEIPTVPE
ncbi:ATP-binding protein [Prevotella sp.]|uniref:ATP-binding protein n=1 Tax=Prevotella sp. TaxID=59823 RepID=UPI002A7FF3E8|nr:AAA family ATPase [Prevotella sp.]MDY4645817.1 AAA family ATPase [Prevotella sp.]